MLHHQFTSDQGGQETWAKGKFPHCTTSKYTRMYIYIHLNTLCIYWLYRIYMNLYTVYIYDHLYTQKYMHLYAFVCICMHLYAFVCICIVHLYASNVYVFVCFMMFYVHTFSTFASLRSFESVFSLPKRIGICSSAHCHPGHRGCGSRKTSSAPKHRSSGRWRSSGCRRWCRSTWEHRGDPDNKI